MSEYCVFPGSDGPVYPATAHKIRKGFVLCDKEGKPLGPPSEPEVKPEAKPTKHKKTLSAHKPAAMAAEASSTVAAEQPTGE